MPGIGINDLRAITPALVLFLSGITVLVVDLFRRGPARQSPAPPPPPPMHPVVHLLAAGGAFLAGVAVLAGLGQAPGLFWNGGIRVELFSRVLGGIIVLGTLLTTCSAAGYLRRHGIEDGEFHALVLLGAGAMVLLAQSNSLITLFLSLETFSMAVYVLTAMTRDEKRSVEGGLKYLILGGFSSGFLLLGLALVFGATGEIRFDLMAARIAAGEADRALLLPGAGLVLVGFGFKLGAFPFQAWLPDVYQGAPTLVTAFMSVAVKTAAIAALTRVTLVLFRSGPAEVRTTLEGVIAVLAVATCVFGNVAAIVQSSVKRMLAYSGIAHTGYLLIGLVAALSLGAPGAASSGGITAGSAIVFYLLPYALMTFGAFVILAILGEGKEDAETFDSLRGLSQKRPLLALAMLIFMVSLAGIPPTAGFWAKLYLFREAVAAGRWDLALWGILTSIVAVYYYLRLVVVMYMQPASAPEGASGGPPHLADETTAWTGPAAILFAAAGIVVIGLFPETLLQQSALSIETLFRP